MIELLSDPNAWIAFGTLTVMEIVLGIDNIVFISVLVSRLPKEQAELLRIFYYEEKPHSVIADELGLPLGTVKSRLRLALAKLRTMLGGMDA